MSDIKLDIPDITVLVDKGDEYLTFVQPSEIFQTNVTSGDIYNVNINQAFSTTIISSGSFYRIADFAFLADSASYVVSASYASNAGTASYALNAGSALSGGLVDYIPVWTGEDTLGNSIIHQTGSSIILNGTTSLYPEHPETLGIYNYSENSYNLIIGHGRIDNYIQFNIKNELSGSIASSDIVATADNGDEYQNYINMGINSSLYTASFGGPNDGYFFSTGKRLLIGNASPSESILIFAGGYPQYDDSLVKIKISPFNKHEVTGSLEVTEGVTGSFSGPLIGTASTALVALQVLQTSFTGSFTGSFFGNGNGLIFTHLNTSQSSDSQLTVGNVHNNYQYKQTTTFRNGDVVVSGSTTISDEGMLILTPRDAPLPVTLGGIIFSSSGELFIGM